MDYPYKPQKIDTIIGSAAGTSGVIDLAGYTLGAIQTPSALTGGTITFLAGTAVDPSNGTAPVGSYSPVYDSANNQVSVIVGTNQVHTDIPELAPLRYIQLVMGTQAAARNFAVFVK